MHKTVFLCSILLLGCGQEEERMPPARQKITLDSLGIEVRGEGRRFMLSDKRGGFLVGNPGEGTEADEWSVNGQRILSGIVLKAGDRSLMPDDIDHATVFPHRLARVYKDGTVVWVSLLDGSLLPWNTTHGLVVKVETRQPEDLSISPIIDGSVARVASEKKMLVGRAGGNLGDVFAYAGESGVAAETVMTVRGSKTATFLLVFTRESEKLVPQVFTMVDTLQRSRLARMEALLEASYFGTSDARLNKALSWAKLSLDALMVEGRDTFAVAGLPWDGAMRGRENAQSIAGIGLATGDYNKTGAIIRTLARWQDTVRSKPTYGRIADRVQGSMATFAGADVGPWFFREMYEHAVYSNDTALVRSMLRTVRRGMDGTLKYHTDSLGFLVHGDGETWMNSVVGGNPVAPRGNRAAELQHLWYFQQLVSSFVASFAGDSISAERWSASANRTVENFNQCFIDTATNLVYDHLGPDGSGALESRPNALFCLELIASEDVVQTMTKHTVNSLVYPHGVGTLGRNDSRFRPRGGEGGAHSLQGAMHNGLVWTFLTGQLIYALTRFDRQDFTYQLTRALTDEMLDRGMAGTLPEMIEVASGRTVPPSVGLDASLTGTAEFIRSMYQDYLGIKVDAPSKVLTLQPKLPDELTYVDFTVYSGRHPINGMYQRGAETSRIILDAPDIPEPFKVRFFWMLDNGNAWRGTVNLPRGVKITIVMSDDDALLFEGQAETRLPGKQKLTGFSRREEFSGIEFVKPPAD